MFSTITWICITISQLHWREKDGHKCKGDKPTWSYLPAISGGASAFLRPRCALPPPLVWANSPLQNWKEGAASETAIWDADYESVSSQMACKTDAGLCACNFYYSLTEKPTGEIYKSCSCNAVMFVERRSFKMPRNSPLGTPSSGRTALQEVAVPSALLGKSMATCTGLRQRL